MAQMKIQKAEMWVAEQIIAHMENAELPPWRKPWNDGMNLPHNALTGRRYSGWNMWALMLAPHDDPRYITGKNVHKLGGTIKVDEQGEKLKPYTVLFWKFPTEAEKHAGKIPFCRAYKVYNIEQTEGVDESKLKPLEKVEESDHTPVEACEAIVKGFKEIPKIEHGGNRAAYSPAFDKVMMPQMKNFSKVEEYYSTLFHELGHSTGHESRLDREEVMNPIRFGSHDYSKEELVAEFTAAQLCGNAGIAPTTLENSAAYIKSWHKKLKNDPELLAQAIRDANKAVRMIMGTVYEDKKEKAA